MRCPRCSLVDIPPGTPACVVCGYRPESADTESVPAAAPTELDARRELAREFRIEALLSPGPASVLYLAYDPRHDRHVMVKLAPRGPVHDAGVEDRFRRAVEAAATLDHPHIIPIYRGGATAHFLWYSTKQVTGRSVEEIVHSGGPMALADCLRLLEQVGSALDYAHRRGVFHGALAAANVIVDPNEWAFVSDFAVAEVVATSPAAAAVLHARGPTPSADQYALAVLAYQCLSGATLPAEPAPRLSDVRPDTPPHVSAALRRALSPRPLERFPSVLDFVAAVGGTSPGGGAGPRPSFSLNPRREPGSPIVIMDFEPEPRRVRRRVAAAAGVVLALGAGGVWLGLSSLPAAPAIESRMGRPTTLAPPPPPAPAPAPTPAPAAPRAQSSPVVNEPLTRAEAKSPASQPRVERPPPAVPRPAAPRVTHTTPATVKRPTPPPVNVERRTEPARLSVNAIPWGNVYIDGQLIGNTPQTDLPVWPGMHSLRVEREGFQRYERSFEAAPGQRLRITDIVLRELAP